MTTADLLDEIAACERRVRGLQARQLRLLAEYADAERDGLRPGACELTERAVAMEAAAALGVSIASARMLVGDAECLVGRLPAVLAALEAGAAARRADQARARRDVWVLPKDDGVATLGATLPAEQALACWAALDSHARGRRADGDDRPIAQIMTDTLVERVTGAARADAAAQIELQVVITDQSLLGATDQPATLAGHGPIPAHTATRLSAQTKTWVRRLLTDPVTGAVTTADAKRRRFFAGAARDLVKIRDRRCRNPVCDAPIRDLDHRLEHAAGGPTTPDNAVTRQPDHDRHGDPAPDAHRITWTGPSGHPRPSLAPPALGHGTPTLDQLRNRRRLLEPEGPSG